MDYSSKERGNFASRIFDISICPLVTLVLPHLQYCLINWGNFKGDGNLKLKNKLFNLQKAFVRIITASQRLSRTDPLFAKLKILKIDDL